MHFSEEFFAGELGRFRKLGLHPPRYSAEVGCEQKRPYVVYFRAGGLVPNRIKRRDATAQVRPACIFWLDVGGILGDAIVDTVDGLDELLENSQKHREHTRYAYLINL